MSKKIIKYFFLQYDTWTYEKMFMINPFKSSFKYTFKIQLIIYFVQVRFFDMISY